MHSDDTSHMKPQDIATATALLSRLPIQARFERCARAAWAYPIVGVVVALICAITAWGALALGVSTMLAAFVWVATGVVVTGAMHEDGLADTADGFWGGWERARRLEIMKDSQIGSYGVIALILCLGARVLAVASVLSASGWIWPLLAVAMLSRAAMPCVMAALPHARDTGLSHSQGHVSWRTAGLAVGLAAIIAFVLMGWAAIGLMILAALTTAGIAALAKAKIGGQTGDVLGATQILVELTLLAALAS